MEIIKNKNAPRREEAEGGGATNTAATSEPKKPKTARKDKEPELSPEEMHFNQRELEKDVEAGRTMRFDRDEEAKKGTMEFEAEQAERKNILDELKKKEEESAKVYNEVCGKSDASRSFLKRAIGASSDVSKEVSDVRLAWLKDLKEWEMQSLVEIDGKLNRGEITSEDSKAQRLEIRNNVALRIAEVRGRETKKREDQGIKRGWLSEKVANGSKHILEKYKKLPFLVKLGLGVGFGIAGGYYAVAGLGAMRFLGGIISGKATHDKLQSSAEWWRKRSSLKDIAREEKQYEKEGLSEKEKLERTMKSLKGMSDRIDAKAKEEGYFDVVRKLAAWTVGGIIGSGTLARAWSELGIGRAVSEKIQHLFGLDHGALPGAVGAKGAITPEGGGKGAIIPEKIPGKTGLSEALEMKKNHSSMGTLRRFALSKFDMITGDGHYNPNDALVNDYYQNMKFHHKLPGGLTNFEDVRSMPKNMQHEFFKFCDSRMNDYYHGLKRTIVENMRHDPKYYGSLSSEMKQLADSVNNYGDYRNLPPGLKKVVFADREAANWIFDKHHSFENVPKLRAGQLLNVTQDANGKIFLGDVSGMKAGHLHHGPTHGAGGAVAENYTGRGGGAAGQAAAETYGRGGGAVDTSHFDRQIEEARARGAEAGARGREAVARLGAEAHALNEQAVAGLTSANARLWNSWLENLGGFKLNTPAHQIQEAIGRLSPGITSDMPLPPTASEMIQRGSAISFTQETFQRFPTLNARETMQQYLERMARTNFNLFKALSITNKL